jgi:hypothetical protein
VDGDGDCGSVSAVCVSGGLQPSTWHIFGGRHQVNTWQ